MRTLKSLYLEGVEQCYHLVSLSGADIKQVLSEMLKPHAKVRLLLPLYLNSRESTSEVISSEKSSHGWGET